MYTHITLHYHRLLQEALEPHDQRPLHGQLLDAEPVAAISSSSV